MIFFYRSAREDHERRVHFSSSIMVFPVLVGRMVMKGLSGGMGRRLSKGMGRRLSGRKSGGKRLSGRKSGGKSGRKRNSRRKSGGGRNSKSGRKRKRKRKHKRGRESEGEGERNGGSEARRDRKQTPPKDESRDDEIDGEEKEWLPSSDHLNPRSDTSDYPSGYPSGYPSDDSSDDSSDDPSEQSPKDPKLPWSKRSYDFVEENILGFVVVLVVGFLVSRSKKVSKRTRDICTLSLVGLVIFLVLLVALNLQGPEYDSP